MDSNQVVLKAALVAILLGSSFSASVVAQDSNYTPADQQILPPACLTLGGSFVGDRLACNDNTHNDWLRDITHWRTERRIRIGYDGARYERSELKWAQSSFIQPQMMVNERYFYDPVAGKYTVDRYLDDLDKRYGGIDSVLIWPTYPNMGIDNRNQWDMVRSMPGGVDGVRKMVADFHRHGVKVLFPMMMWDQGTREEGSSAPQAIARLMKEVDADGINGDTQDGVPLAFSLAAEKLDHPLAFEPELSPADEAVAWDVLNWSLYKFQFVPTVDRYRWLEPRHQVNISDRWSRNKTDDLQFAFFNGEGWESWENVWGIWNGITPRDAEATRRVATLERGIAPFLVSPGWEPMFPMQRYGVYASRWPLGGQTVWTIVNRNEYTVSGRQIAIPYRKGEHYYDLYHGVELTAAHEGDTSVLSFDLEGHGYGAVIATSDPLSQNIQTLLTKMKSLSSRPLNQYADEWKPLPQRLVEIASTKISANPPAGMVKIPSSTFTFKVDGVEIEGRDDAGVDVQYPWEDSPRRFHEHPMEVKPFYIDTYPVTNADFKRFLEATKYHPKDDLNFLKDWSNGQFPKGWDKKPVTWVSRQDAMAYLSWAGKRLPHEWEWQLAAQGTDDRVYPWGNTWDAARVPVPDTSRSMRGPDDVDAHPAGASASGVADMTGNIWQWTDLYEDEHTQAAILRGGSYYQPQGSKWYFPNVFRNDQHGKLLMMAPSYDRSATVGFRGVVDAKQDAR